MIVKNMKEKKNIAITISPNVFEPKSEMTDLIKIIGSLKVTCSVTKQIKMLIKYS